MVNRLATAPNRTVAASAALPTAPTDGELLMRYVRHDDDEAFAAVVERHGPMIWGVCSRVLVRRADAEDAYQATLLILARKAGTIRPNDSAAGWLFRVAHNAALGALRRRKVLREETLPDDTLPAEEAFPNLEQKQLVVTLMDELQTLPSKYKTPLVLRYLEGRSRREIAAAMDATVATVAGRLVRGRRMLRSRLARRGVSLSVVLGALGVGSAVHAAGAVRAASPPFDPTLLAPGASGPAAALANQGVRSMLYASLSKPAAFGLAAAIAALTLLVGPPEGASDALAAEPSLEQAASDPDSELSDDFATASLVATSTEPSAVAIPVPGGGLETPSGEAATGTADWAVQEDTAKVFANLREHYAQLAGAETGRDLSQPGFEELYWQANHWRAKQDLLRRALEAAANRKQRELADAVAKGEQPKSDEFDPVDREIGEIAAQLPLAKAKIAEYERLMKQAALRETRPVKALPAASNTNPYQAPTSDRNSTSSLRMLPWQDFSVGDPSSGSGLTPSQRALRTRALASWGAPLGGGDTLLFEFSSDESPTPSFRRCTVDYTGELDLGSGFGKVPVAMKSLAEVNELIKGRFAAEMPGLVAKLSASYREGPANPPSVNPPLSGWAAYGGTAPPTEVPAAILSPGDTVLIDSTLDKRVARINERCVVEADGTIGLGAAIGRVKVSGLTMRQAEKAVQEHVDKDWDDVTIQLTPVEVPIPTPVYQEPVLPGNPILPRPLPNQGFGVPSNRIR